MALAALIVSIVAAVATAFGVFVTRKATDIERDRRHAELRPRYQVTLESNPGSDQRTLRVKLVGPGELEKLDEVIVSIRDDNPWRRKQPPAAGQPAEAVPDHVWSRLRFVPGTGPGFPDAERVADSAGRTTRSVGMNAGDYHTYTLQPSIPPPHPNWTQQTWIDQLGPHLKLRIEGRRDTGRWKRTWAPWIAVAELDTTEDTASVELT